VKSQAGLHLQLNDDGKTIAAWPTTEKALAFYEQGYARKHMQSYEGSMSACINWMQFQPSVVTLSLEEVRPLVDWKKDEKTGKLCAQVQRVSGLSGGFDGITLLSSAEAVWEAGAKPKLVPEKT
jgi:hypothetical protein